MTVSETVPSIYQCTVVLIYVMDLLAKIVAAAIVQMGLVLPVCLFFPAGVVSTSAGGEQTSLLLEVQSGYGDGHQLLFPSRLRYRGTLHSRIPHTCGYDPNCVCGGQTLDSDLPDQASASLSDQPAMGEDNIL